MVNHELNYKLVRDDYAIVNDKDITLPSILKMRMIRDTEYAKNKKIGIWSNSTLIKALNSTYLVYTKNKIDTRAKILKKQINAFPKSAKLYLDRKIVAQK